jgi:hypothetical protein
MKFIAYIFKNFLKNIYKKVLKIGRLSFSLATTYPYCYAKCRISIVKLSAVMLNVVMLSFVMRRLQCHKTFMYRNLQKFING